MSKKWQIKGKSQLYQMGFISLRNKLKQITGHTQLLVTKKVDDLKKKKSLISLLFFIKDAKANTGH